MSIVMVLKIVRRGSEANLSRVVEVIEKRYGISLPREVIDFYIDEELDILFIRFRNPRGVEVGEPLEAEEVATLFIDEETGDITAIEVIGLEKLLKDLQHILTTTPSPT